MGLDNYVLLKTRRKINIGQLPSWMDWLASEIPAENNGQFQYEIVYFRKAWCFRRAVLDIINADNQDACRYEYDLKRSDITKIRDVLYKFLCDPDEWDDGNQVFYMNESFKYIAREILNLTWLDRYLQEDKTAYATFIDSY